VPDPLIRHRLSAPVRDVLRAGVVTAVMLTATLVRPPRGSEGGVAVVDRPLVAVLVVLAGAALVLARRHPVIVLGVVTLLTSLALARTGQTSPVAVAVVAAAFAVGALTDRRTELMAAVPAAVLLGGVGALAGAGSVLRAGNLALVAWIGMAVAVGDALRTRRDYVLAVLERAERAERTREEEARRQVAEERLRIARELHDVVAHHISVANVQAGVAEHLLTSDPPGAATALAHVRASSRAVLDELSTLLGVLRTRDDPAGPTEPAPGLHLIEPLVGSFTAAGLDVEWGRSGEPAPVSAAVDLTAYRIVQEGLTNAHKHGTGTATVSLSWAPQSLLVRVLNPLRPNESVHVGVSGHGLVGMRERALAVGGSLEVGPQPDGTFRVEARLPVSSR
jgi:signal transduction histidine kinase